MNYRLLISTTYQDWEEHFNTQAEAETRMESLEADAIRNECCLYLELLRTIEERVVNGRTRAAAFPPVITVEEDYPGGNYGEPTRPSVEAREKFDARLH